MNEDTAHQRYLRGATATSGDGSEVPFSAGVSEVAANALFKFAFDHKVTRALEIGMAQGVSSLAILGGQEDWNGTLTSVDPYQSTQWEAAGLSALSSAGFIGRHTLLEMPDYVALPRLLADGLRFDFIYIDGWHSFDFVLLDAFFADKLLDTGGVLAFNDCGWPAVHKVLKFISTHWSWYRELDIGVHRTYTASSRPKTLARWLLRRVTEDRYFLKTASEQVPWDFYRPF